ncbi:MAG: ABC transporter permease [Candidatus Rokubacteria bacterium]|nr:ABC transporter permease [Candidatus Rokubacteria bacterium]
MRNALAEIAKYAFAFAVAALAGAVLVAVMRGDVLGAYRTFVWSSLGTAGGFAQTLNKMCPLLLGGLAVGLALRGGYFNIGVDGQIYAGAIAATGVALALETVANPALAPFAVVVGVLGGAAFAAIPAVLRAWWSVNEIFVTVMLNFVAVFLTEYLTTGPWNDVMAGEAITRLIPDAAKLPMLSVRAGSHVGIFLALASAVLVWLVLERTRWGFEVRALGDNERAARVAGIRTAWVTAAVLVASGALAGLAGAIEVTALHHRLILGLTPGYGIMAILIAVLGKARPLGILAASFAMAILLVGSDSLQRSVGLPASAALVFQALIVLSVLFVDAKRSVRA